MKRDGNKIGYLEDDLIREALHRDIETTEHPPVKASWERVEAVLTEKPVPDSRSGSRWARYSALAAGLLLLVFLGSMGLRQVAPDLASLPVEDSPERTADSLEVEFSGDDAGIMLEEETEEIVETLPPMEKTKDPSPPDWRETLPGNFYYEEAFLLSAGEGPAYHGAIYYGEEEELIWVKSGVEGEDRVAFVENLTDHIQASSFQVEIQDDYLFFEASGQPGLAWQEADYNQALLVVSGPLTFEKLVIMIDQLVKH